MLDASGSRPGAKGRTEPKNLVPEPVGGPPLYAPAGRSGSLYRTERAAKGRKQSARHDQAAGRTEPTLPCEHCGFVADGSLPASRSAERHRADPEPGSKPQEQQLVQGRQQCLAVTME